MLKFVRAGLQITLVLVATAALYLTVLYMLQRPWQPEVLLGLLILALGFERGWAFVRWLNPLHGTFGNADQEYSLLRALDRELSRSLRHDAPLVVVAVHGKRTLAVRTIEKILRISDIVIPGHNGHIMVIMTETSLDQAHLVMSRMAEHLPIIALAMADERAVAPLAGATPFGVRKAAPQNPAQGRTLAMVRALQLGVFRARARIKRDEPTPIYVLTPADVLAATNTTNDRAMEDFTQHVA